MRYHYFAIVAQAGVELEQFEDYVTNSLDNSGIEADYTHFSIKSETAKFEELFKTEFDSFSDRRIVAELAFELEDDEFEFIDDVNDMFRNDHELVRRRYVRKFTPRQAGKLTLTSLIEVESDEDDAIEEEE